MPWEMSNSPEFILSEPGESKDLTGTSAELAFVHEIFRFRAKNRQCDDVYLKGKRRSSDDFAAEI